MVTPAVKRAAVAHAGQAHDVSERRACAIFGVDRSMVRYRSRRPNDDAIRERMRKLAMSTGASVSAAWASCCAVKGLS